MKKVIQVKFGIRNSISIGQTDNLSDGYSFFTDLELTEGDYVVVDTQRGLQVAIVDQTIGLASSQTSKAGKWVISKLDICEHQKRIETQKIAQEIRNKLRERKEQMEEIIIYRQMAKEDPEIALLLEKLGSIDPGLLLSSGES